MSAALPGGVRAARDLADSWLSHLRRDLRGLPVPWINRWGQESMASTHIGWEPLLNRLAIFHDDTGNIPDFTRQNIARQRLAMMAGKCQVCGRPCPWSRRNLIISGVSTEQIALPELGARAVAAISEPWLDDRCAAIATTMCPALIRREHADDLVVVPVRRAKDVRLITSVGMIKPDSLANPGDALPDHVARLRAACERGPVAMWVKVVMLNHRIDFRDEVDPAADDVTTGHARC